MLMTSEADSVTTGTMNKMLLRVGEAAARALGQSLDDLSMGRRRPIARDEDRQGQCAHFSRFNHEFD